MKKLVLLLLVCLFVVFGVLPLYGASPTTIVLTVGDTNALVNGNAIQLDVAPFIKDGRTFVPLRFVSEQLGAQVDYTTKADGSVDQVTVKMGFESSPPDTSGLGTVGQKVIVEGAALTVVQVAEYDSFGYFKPKEGNTYLNAEVIVENISREKVLANPFCFAVKDSDDYKYSATLASADPSLKSSNLLQGERARGNIAFEVPISAHGFVLIYQSGMMDTPIKVNLGL